MKWRSLRGHSITYFIAGIICLHIAYVNFTAVEPVVIRNEYQQIVAVADLATVFRVIACGMLVIGALFLANAIRGWIAQKRIRRPETDVRNSNGLLFRDSWVWIVVNLALIPLGVWAGYEELSPRKLQGTNPDGVLCSVLVVIMSIFVLGILHFSHCDRFRSPAWNRSPFRWRDPLQALFFTTVAMSGMFLGSLSRLGQSGMRGFWSAAVFGSMVIGLLIGQAIAYSLYRGRIIHD